MFEWGSRGAGDRGVSHVLGVVLLASTVIIGAVLIVQVGQQTIGDVNDDANVELAEEVLLSVDQSFQRSDTNESVQIPDRVRSDVAVSDNAAYNLTLNGRSACSTGNRSLQTVRYQENGHQVGYQGGGVWRMTESGATMSSPPAVSYDEGALSVSFANISGQQIKGSSVEIRSNATAKRSHEAALQMALFTDASYEDARTGSISPPSYECPPSQVANATLTIENSSYARAWADWARSTYDDQYVTVTPASAEPGETIHIRFALGDVSDSKFAVDNITVQSDPSNPGQATVSATVTNTGGLKDTQTITLKHNRSGAPSEATQTVTLSGGESIAVSDTVDIAVAKPHNFTVESDHDTAFERIVYTTVPGTPSLDITGSSMPATARLNQVPSATVTVTNNGEMTADQEVVFLVNGSVNATRNVMVDPGQSRTVDFGPSMPTDENGTYDLEVKTEDDTYSQPSDDGSYFIVGDSGVFEVASVSPPGGVESGETATIGATIKNTGDIRSTSSVKIHIKDESGAEVDSKSRDLTLNGTRNGAEEETITLTSGSLTAPSYSNYTYLVETPNDAVNGTFTVGASAPPVFDITSVSVDNPVRPENKTKVSFTVSNTGGAPDTQTLHISRDWGANKSSEVQLDPGKDKTFTQTFATPSEEGLYRLDFTTENQTAWRMLNVQQDAAVERDGEGGLTTTKRVNASIELKGAELESSGTEYISHSRVEMSLVVENQSGTYQMPLWRDAGNYFENGDVNGPYAERRLINRTYANPYEYSKTFEENSTFSIVAASYYCDGHTKTDVTFEIDQSEYDTYRCSDPDGVRISISDPENSQNVDILGDGERIPGYGQAYPEQRNLADMLGEQRLNETEDSDNATLSLADGERVFLYELSTENASPENAYSSNDPDYNDAMALFRVNSIEESISQPKFRIVDVDAPARVDETNAYVTATVKNVGGGSGNATLTSTFDGNESGAETKQIGPNGTKQFTFIFGTDSKPTEQSYPYKISLSDESKEWGGNIYVGERDEQFMQVDSVRAPSAINSYESANTTITITNVGDEAGIAEIKLYTKNTDEASPTFTESDSATTALLTNGDTEQLNLSMPTDRGNYTYYVQTRNSTSAMQSFFVGRSNVVVNDTQGVNIGAEKYNTSTLIERRGDAQRMTVEVFNNGTVGDEREVNLTIKNKSDGSTVFTGSTNVTAGSGDLRDVDKYPAWAGYDTDLDPGYYTYNVTVHNHTASRPIDTATGEIYLKEVDQSGATTNDSPISIDSDTITIGS
ncbi:DUF7289 family protein [Haloarcula japonica]|uniref:DUF7289 family protein n=1 Tax=Haloarcula japonica TaxID=29282 RepID=UPI0030AA44A6